MLLLSALVAGSSSVWADTTGTINFGSASGSLNINAASVSGSDTQSKTWTVTTTGTTSFNPTTSYAQIGSSSKPASSITFTATIASETVNVKSISAKFGGFSGTAGTVTLKVGDTSVGSGSLSATSDVTVSSTKAQTGTVVTVTVTGISKGVKAYYITYTYEAVSSGATTTTTISDAGITNTNKFVSTAAGSLSASVTYGDPAAAVPEASVTWSGDADDVATINASTGEVTLVGAGTVTFTASYAGVADTYKSSSDTYELIVTNEDPSLVEIWSEDFSDYSADDVPSGGTYSYVCVDGNSDTKIYADANAGGESPELLINKKGTNNGSFSATIPLNNGYTGTLKLIFKNNNSINVSVTDNTSAVLKSSTAISANTTTGNIVEISGVTAETTSITILWSNSSSANVRLDDIVLKGKEAPAKPTFSEDAKTFNSSFDMTISSETGTTLKYTTDGTNPAESGTAISVASNSKEITISGTEDVTVKAIAIKDEVISAVASVTYTYDARPAPTFTLSDTEMTILVLSDDETITLTTNSDGAVTFTSSDGEKLDVDNTAAPKVCVLTAIETGDYTVTVRTAATVNYLAGEGTVTVHVIKLPTTITTTASFASTDLKDASSGSFTGVAKYNDAAIVGAEVTYSSSNTKVATINSTTGAVTYLKAGTTRLTASYEGTDDYAACEAYYDLTLTDTRPQDVEVSITLNNSFFGQTGTISGTTLDEVSASKSNINVEILRNDGNLYLNNTGTRLYPKSLVTFEAPTGYYISQIVLKNGDSATDADLASDSGSYTDGTWSGGASSVQFSAGKTFTSSFKTITTAIVTLAETVTIGSAGYTTYVAKHNISFPDGLTAYISTAKTSETLKLTEKASVPQGTPIILEGSAATYALPTITTSPESVTGNLLEASDGTVEGDGSTIYALGKKDETVGFYLVKSGVTVPAGKAYLTVGAGAKEFLTFDFSDDADGIVSPLGETEERASIYNLSGQRLQKMQKGINIVNGKKVLY